MTLALPAEARSAAGMAASSSVPETNVVVLSELFHRTFEPLMKLLPSTISVKEGPPAVPQEGLRLMMAGWGPRISNVIALERLPSGLNTVIGAVPAMATSAARIFARSWVADTKVVTRSEPFHRTFEPETKLLPETVSVKVGLPMEANCGASEAIWGVPVWGFLKVMRPRSGMAL